MVRSRAIGWSVVLVIELGRVDAGPGHECRGALTEGMSAELEFFQLTAGVAVGFVEDAQLAGSQTFDARLLQQ